MSAVRADLGARFLRLGAGIHTLVDAVFFRKEPRCGTGVLSHSFQAHTSLLTVQTLLHTWAASASLDASRVTFQLEGTDFPCGYIRADFCEKFDS